MNRARSRPDVQQLAIFLEVVDARSFTAAARRLGRSQPAISQAIARLEEMYRGQLFHRRPGAPLRLTPIGRAILPSARMLVHAVDAQMARAAQLAERRRGTLTLGVHAGIAAGPLRNGLAAFVAAHPDLRLRLVEGPPDALRRQFNDRAVDLLIAAQMPALAATSVVREVLWQERLVVALREDHPLADRDELSWEEVGNLRLLVGRPQGRRGGYRAILPGGGGGRFACEPQDVSDLTLLAMVAIGMGATLSFASAIPPWPGIALRPIAGAEALVAVEAIRRRGEPDPLRRQLLACLRRHAGIVSATGG